MEKKFKPFDRVLVRQSRLTVWECDFYSHYNATYNTHVTIGYDEVERHNILPYEGNESLLGTIAEPEEEIKLEEGEYGFFVTKPLMEYLSYYSFGRFNGTTNNCMINSASLYYDCFIRFSDFNPDDMEETKKHILCVKNGKVVKYKE